MDAKRYADVIKENEGKIFTLLLDPFEVGVLNAALIAVIDVHLKRGDDPKVIDDMVRRLRRNFDQFFQNMGFSLEERIHLAAMDVK